MRLRPRRPALALGSLAVLATISLTACGGDSEESADAATDDNASSAASEPTTESSESTETESTETESTDTETEEAPAGAEGQPSWALPVTTPGEKLTTIEVGDVTVDVYQVGTAKADDTGSFVDPDTNKPLIEPGDDLVFLNYVVTNNGDPIDLGSSLVDVEARYDDWPYLGGMDGLVSDELFEAQDVNKFELAPGGFNDAGIYTLGTGETFSYGENFEYQADSPIGFEVTYVPVDAEGELIFDDRVEGEGSATTS